MMRPSSRPPRSAADLETSEVCSRTRRSILVIGVGNEALKDEGIGIHAARALAALDLPPSVRVLEGGTEGFSLLGRLEGVQRLVLVDAMGMDCPAGTVVTVRREQLRRRGQPDRSSLHGTGVLDALELAAALGLEPPEVYIVGVQPAEVTWGLELSPVLQQVLPRVVGEIVAAIGYLPPAGSDQPGSCSRAATGGFSARQDGRPED
jgi:hydrogenase maturation protease